MGWASSCDKTIPPLSYNTFVDKQTPWKLHWIHRSIRIPDNGHYCPHCERKFIFQLSTVTSSPTMMKGNTMHSYNTAGWKVRLYHHIHVLKMGFSMMINSGDSMMLLKVWYFLSNTLFYRTKIWFTYSKCNSCSGPILAALDCYVVCSNAPPN